MKAPSTTLLVSAGVVIFAVVAAIAGASNTAKPPGVHNGVITACVEPLTKDNKPTSGDLKLFACPKGARTISWNIRGPRTRGPAGSPEVGRFAQGPEGPKGRKALQATGRGRQVRTGATGAKGPAGPQGRQGRPGR